MKYWIWIVVVILDVNCLAFQCFGFYSGMEGSSPRSFGLTPASQDGPNTELARALKLKTPTQLTSLDIAHILDLLKVNASFRVPLTRTEVASLTNNPPYKLTEKDIDQMAKLLTFHKLANLDKLGGLAASGKTNTAVLRIEVVVGFSTTRNWYFFMTSGGNWTALGCADRRY